MFLYHYQLCGNQINALENYQMRRLFDIVSNSGNLDTVYEQFKKYIDSQGGLCQNLGLQRL
ncbi:unnamed protein product [Paramecium sonneborni]|uniref:Uncharacterized protein n=1 Tax=Paramecium sonneborni TaxID=65129 RepID=A0A8S1RP24_9CILI|nr:unnamed protein product [Paramecium sonneborni]